MNLIILFLFVTGFIGCDKKEPIIPDPPIEEKAIDIKWATRIDSTREIVSCNFTQLYKDWVLVSGDLDDPPTVYAFNKKTGKLDWKYVHDGIVKHKFNFAKVVKNKYIGVSNDGIIALNLDTRKIDWEIDLKKNNYNGSFGILFDNNKLYHDIGVFCGSTFCGNKLIEIDFETGSYDIIFESLEAISPSALYNSDGDKFLVFNIYPDNNPPEKSIQDIGLFSLNEKEIIWRTKNFTNFFASNAIHNPIIYKDKVITGGDWSMYAFDIKTGKQEWKYSIPGYTKFGIWITTNHLIYNDRLYVNENGFDVTCLNPETGALIWNNPKGGPNCTDNMLYYEKEDLLVFTSWGYGSVMVLDGLTGETIHREHEYANSSYNNDVVYDKETDVFFTSTYKHVVGFTIKRVK